MRQRHLMTYLIPALVLACMIGLAIGWEFSKNKHLRRQVRYVIECAALLVLFALVPILCAVPVLLIPALTYLFRLVLRGQLDDEFHPITTGERR